MLKQPLPKKNFEILGNDSLEGLGQDKILKQEIPLKVALAMRTNYERHRLACTSPQLGAGQEQTKWVWFSLSELRRLFEILQKNYPDPKYTDHERGIKFYFAVYPEGTRIENGFDYKDRMTLVLVPSVKAGEYFVDHEDLTASPAITDNVGAMCPPRCQATGDIL